MRATDHSRGDQETIGIVLDEASEAAFQARLMAAISVPSPGRQEVMRRERVVWALGFGTAFAVFLLAGGFREWGVPRGASQIAVTFAGALALALAALRFGYGRGGSMLGRSREALLATALLAPVSLFAWKYGWSTQFDGGTVFWAGRVGYRCLTLALLTGGAVLAAMIATRKGSELVQPRLSGASMGVAAGAVAAVFTELWCPVGHPGHIGLGHVLPMLILGALGALPGSLVLMFRPESR